MIINLIQNGTFSSGSANWSGTDHETAHSENTYLGNGSFNRVAEVDGDSGQTTVMEQTFNVAGPVTTQLTFRTALRPNGGDIGDGFVVQIRDSSGAIILHQTVTPTSNSFQTYTIPVTFPAAGDYTISFTEIGNDDSYGALLDDVSILVDDSILVCFAGGTQIDTPQGMRLVQDLAVGDRVNTVNGVKILRWIGRRHVDIGELSIDPKTHPVRISKGALGAGLPTQDLYVSRQHRMLLSPRVALRMFGTRNVLIAAHRLVELPGVDIVAPDHAMDYFHLLFDDHEIVYANGAPSESLLVTAHTVNLLPQAMRDEIHLMCPQLPASGAEIVSNGHIIPKAPRQKRMVQRMLKNTQPAIDTADQRALG